MKRLYINSELIDLNDKERIGYTKQVNSLKDLASRQTNFTKVFRVPDTAKNRAIFKGLGIAGSTSIIPYQKNTSKLFIDNICLIYNGLANFPKTAENYEVYIYDGNIGFFKKLDNIKFEDLDLSELSHLKTVAEIKDNWENGNNFYSYLLADYNGEKTFDYNSTTYINADYLIPSVPISYLWDRIFSTFGFTYSGSIFSEDEFNDTFITYPKGVVSGDVGAQYFNLDFPNQKMISYINTDDPPVWLFWGYFDFTTQLDQGQIISNTYYTDFKLWQVPEDGYYNIEVTGFFSPQAKKGVDSYFYLAFDLENTKLINLRGALSNAVLISGGSGDRDLDFNNNYYLYAGQTVTFIYDKAKPVNSDNTNINFNATFSKVDQTAIDQFEFFKGLTPKDFYKELMWRFGLTPFPSKDSDHIEFLTYEERINGEVLDWSDKYVRRIGEEYAMEGYAKSNYFRFKYNGEEDDFNDGVILIENENLEEKTDVIKSKTYSVERLPILFPISGTNYELPKLELWEKEVKDENGQTVIDYKSRDARFTFLRKREIIKTEDLGSKQLSQYDSVTKILAADNENYSWQQVIEKRYRPVRSLLNKTKITTVEIMLTPLEFDNFDLKPVLYFEQEGGTFLVDKISKRDLESNLTQIDLIKINK